MKILLVTETYPPEINGVARTLQQMVRGLTAHGHEPLLVRPRAASRQSSTGDGPDRTFEVRGLPLPGYPELQFGLPAGRLIDRLLQRHAIDVAYIATEGPLGRSALRACRRRSVPVLSGLHTNFHQYSAHYRAGLLAPLLLRYLRHFHNQADATLVPTDAMRRQLTAAGFQRLQVWPRGVATELFSPTRRDPQLRSEWGLADDDLAVLYVGRIAPEKGIDTAFRAFEAIRRVRADARFVLVGSGPAETRLRAAHPDAVFTGPKTGTALAAHYASGDLFLFPSQTDTFGNVTLEAMASGLAVVSYDLAAAHELIRHKFNGLLAPGGNEAAFVDAASNCALNTALTRTLKIHARETALQQNWPKLWAKLEQLLLGVSAGAVDDGTESTAGATERP